MRIEDVLQLLAFVSNVIRLPWPQVPPRNRAGGLMVLSLVDSREFLFYRNRRGAQTASSLG